MNKNIPTITGLVIIVAIAVFVIGVMAWQSGWVEKFIPLTTNTPSAISISTPDETANWKTYKNEQYGFEIKYPSNFQIDELKSDTYLLHISFNNPPQTSAAINGFWLEVRNPEKLEDEVNLRRWQFEGHVEYGEKKESPIRHDGFEGVRLEYGDPLGNKDNDLTILIIKTDRYTYTIKVLSKDIDKILSTFRFVE